MAARKWRLVPNPEYGTGNVRDHPLGSFDRCADFLAHADAQPDDAQSRDRLILSAQKQKRHEFHECFSFVEFVAFLLNGAGNGIRTRDFDLGKVALYH